MARDVHPPRGMRDFLPAEKNRRDAVLAQIIESYQKHGFQQIEAPALEDLVKLTASDGGDNEKLAFRVMKRGAELEQGLAVVGNDVQQIDQLSDLGLRFDLTVPLTRYYASNQAKLPRVFKAIQTGPVWRAERPQKGRYRQFVQCDIDVIGEATDLAEIELLNASLDALKAIGLTSSKIRVNHRALLTRTIENLGVASEAAGRAMIVIDKLDKIGADGVVAELAEQFTPEIASNARVWLATLADDLEIPDELATIWSAISGVHPGKLRFDPTLVRGMGYYTGAIFEIEHPDSGSSIGGGGRYDGMVGRWLGKDVPAVGISIGFERVVDLVPAEAGKKSLLVLIYEAVDISKALKVQGEAIAAGFEVRLEPRPKKLNSVLEELAQQGFTHFASLSGDAATFAELEIRPLEP